MNVLYERVEDPGLTHEMSVTLAKEKGGRLCTNEEIIAFLLGTSLLPKEDQWVATLSGEGKRDWVQIGNKYHTPGLEHVKKWDYPTWGDKLDDITHGKPTWQRILVWKMEEKVGGSETA